MVHREIIACGIHLYQNPTGVAVTDLGVLKPQLLTSKHKLRLVEPFFSPEVVLEFLEGFEHISDVFMVGCAFASSMFKELCGYTQFQDEGDVHALQIRLLQSNSPAAEVISRMLIWDYQLRATARTLLEEYPWGSEGLPDVPYLDDIDDNSDNNDKEDNEDNDDKDDGDQGYHLRDNDTYLADHASNGIREDSASLADRHSANDVVNGAVVSDRDDASTADNLSTAGNPNQTTSYDENNPSPSALEATHASNPTFYNPPSLPPAGEALRTSLRNSARVPNLLKRSLETLRHGHPETSTQGNGPVAMSGMQDLEFEIWKDEADDADTDDVSDGGSGAVPGQGGQGETLQQGNESDSTESEVE